MAKELSEAKGLTAVAFLQKPFTLAALRALLVAEGSTPVVVIEDGPGGRLADAGGLSRAR